MATTDPTTPSNLDHAASSGRVGPHFGHLVLLLSAVAATTLAWTRAEDDSVTWQTVSAAAFPDFALKHIEAGLDEAECAELARLLEEGDPATSTRAAVLLGAALDRAGPDPSGAALSEVEIGALLLARLEARHTTEVRGDLGADVVAARALDRRATLAGVTDRLLELAAGEDPHPVLSVRTECAAVVLERNVGWMDLRASRAPEKGMDVPEDERTRAARRRAAAFLLSVLRAETPDEAKSPRTWDRITTLAWPKTRAAESMTRAAAALTEWRALSGAITEGAGEDATLRFRPDGSWAHQMAEADRLESILMAD